MKLWLVRHAAPLVPPGTCYGRLDVPADASGTAAAAQALAHSLPPGTPVYHSPLQRCEQLAQALQALRPDLACNADERLAEFDFGAWEGQPWNAIAAANYDAWTARFAHYRPGGGESLGAMLQRVHAALRHIGGAESQHDRAWITHAGVARCVQWLAAAPPGALPEARQWQMPTPAFGAWIKVDLDGRRY